MSDKLLPCPFCGSDEGYIGLAYVVGCANCGCEGPDAATDAEKIAAWNTRPAAIAALEAGGERRPTPRLTERAEADVAYAIAAYKVWGGQLTPDEALKDDDFSDDCYALAEHICDHLASIDAQPASQQGADAARLDWLAGIGHAICDTSYGDYMGHSGGPTQGIRAAIDAAMLSAAPRAGEGE